MSKRKTGVSRRSGKERKIISSSTDLVEAYQELADQFMVDIFELEPGEYFISDESDIGDFTPFGTSDTAPIWRRIAVRYGLSHEDVGSGRLVRLFLKIAERRRVQ